jgi:hypothetical protein
MKSRLMAALLALAIAAPVCCCGWHNLTAGWQATVLADEFSCPMCAAEEFPDSPAEPECPCARDFHQRDLAPRAAEAPEAGLVWVPMPAVEWLPAGRSLARPLQISSTARTTGTGPPRLHLVHGVLLC